MRLRDGAGVPGSFRSPALECGGEEAVRVGGGRGRRCAMRESDEVGEVSQARAARYPLRVTSVLTGKVSADDEEAYRSELFQYRYETVAMLQKYLSVSLDLGRLPSALGGEMFRAKVTSYKVTSFEDLVVFVIDMQRCMERLSASARKFIALHVFEEYSLDESAARMGCDRVTGWRVYCDAIDEMSEVL